MELFRPSTWRRLALVAVPAVLLMSFTGFLENFLLYHPVREIGVTPADHGVPFRDVRFEAGDGVRLHGWYVEPPAPAGPVLLWAHGNAGNLSHRARNIAMIHRELGAGVFLFDYRGFGRSKGEPGESGLYEDARGAYAWLRARVPPERIFLFGRSLGAAVVVRIAAEGAAARGLILESPFESLAAMGKQLFPFLPVNWFVSQEFDNVRELPRVKLPVLILHGDADNIVPFAQGRQLFERANPPRRFYRIPGAGHNNTWLAGGARYWDAWRSFMADFAQGNPETEGR